jgi:transmembrane sensor
MDNQRIIQLAQKFVDGDITAFELEEFNTWYYSDEGEQYQVKSFDSKEDLAVDMYKKVMERSGLHAEKPMRYRLWPRIAVAASFFVVLGLSLYFYNSKSPDQVELANIEVADISPAGNKAYLTLGNGKRIALTDASNGTIAEQTNVQIIKTADGQLVYTIAKNKSGSSSGLEYNTIETPNGGRYEIALPDGTHVWMNAASTLKYPASFSSLKERRVELQGEAYFQVAKDKQHPFIVKTAQQEVKVLGTHFNINSYANEPETKTTLLEGSVNVANLNGKNSKILTPGQQATVKGDDMKVGDADVDQAMSWKNGDFVFVGEDLKAVMRQVARWYDVEIEYQGNINSSGVVSTISRTKKLSQVLKALQINQGIHFKVEGRRVLVMP